MFFCAAHVVDIGGESAAVSAVYDKVLRLTRGMRRCARPFAPSDAREWDIVNMQHLSHFVLKHVRRRCWLLGTCDTRTLRFAPDASTGEIVH